MALYHLNIVGKEYEKSISSSTNHIFMIVLRLQTLDDCRRQMIACSKVLNYAVALLLI